MTNVSLGIYYQQDAVADSVRLTRLAEALEEVRNHANRLHPELLKKFGPSFTLVGSEQLTQSQITNGCQRAMRFAWEVALENHRKHENA